MVTESPVAAAAALGAPGFCLGSDSWESDAGARASALACSGLSTQCWQLPSAAPGQVWWSFADGGVEVGASSAEHMDMGFISGGNFFEQSVFEQDCWCTVQNSTLQDSFSSFQSSTCNMLVPYFTCGTTELEETEARMCAEVRMATEAGMATEASMATEGAGLQRRRPRHASANEMLGSSVLREVTHPSNRQLGLSIHLCPDEPTGADEHPDKAMQIWRAERLVPKWSAMSPLSVCDAGCIGSVIKNTFVHISPPPASMREAEYSRRRRSSSQPKDMGSVKNIWNATHQAFRFVPSSGSRPHVSSLVQLSDPCDVDPPESTAASDSDLAADEKTNFESNGQFLEAKCNNEDDEPWWNKGSAQTCQARSTPWSNAKRPRRVACKAAWNAEEQWEETSDGRQQWRSGRSHTTKGSWDRDWWDSSERGSRSERVNRTRWAPEGSSGRWWEQRDRNSWW